MSDPLKPFPVLLAELQAAHKASLGSDTKAMIAWAKLVDRNIVRLFAEIAHLQSNLMARETECNEMASELFAVRAKLAECELRATKEFQGRSQLIKDRDTQIEELQGKTRRMEAEFNAQIAKAKQEINEFSLVNFRLAKTVEKLAPGSMKTVSSFDGDQTPVPMHYPQKPPLIMPALEEKFGVFADLALWAAAPDSPRNFPDHESRKAKENDLGKQGTRMG